MTGWYLGVDLYKVTLMEGQRRFKWQLRAIIEKGCISTVLVAGDVYDAILASKEAIELYDNIMYMLCTELKKKVTVIAGNHDSATRLASLSRLLEGTGLYIIGSLREKVRGIRVDDCMVYPVPYLHVEQVKKIYQKDMHLQAEAFNCICTGTLFTADHTHRPIAMMHTFLVNAEVYESDRFANVGGMELIPPAMSGGLSYVAMGRLHRRQHVGGCVQYSGSPLPYSFSEADQPKGVLIYDNQTDMVAKWGIQPLRPLQVCGGSYTDLKERMLKYTVPDRAHVKIEVTDLPASYEMLGYFRQGHENLLQLSKKNMEQEQTNVMVRLQSLGTTPGLDVAQQFFQDHYGEELSEIARQLFLQTQQKLEKEEMYAT